MIRTNSMCNFLSLFFLFCIQTLFAQERKITFEHVSREQGLSQSEVMCIIQDHKGFLWIGTQGGLNRYEGNSFTVYKNNVEDTNSVHNNYIQALYEDRNGMLWVGTRGALHRFDRARGKWERFLHDPKNPHTISNNIISSIHEDTAGVLWVGTDEGLNRYDPEKRQFVRVFHDKDDPGSVASNAIRVLYTDKSGTFWIGTSNGLDYFDSRQGKFAHFSGAGADGLTSNFVTSMCEDRDGGFWIGTRDGLNRVNRSSWHVTQYRSSPDNLNTLSDNYIGAIAEDEAGTLWIGTDQGVNIFDRHRGRFVRYVNDPKNVSSLSEKRVNAILHELSGTIWIGTHGGGLNKVDRNKEHFAHIVYDPNTPTSLSNNLVWSIFEDRKDFLWIGTEVGLNKLDRASGTVTHYMNNAADPHSLGSNIVYSILETSSGELWVGTDHGLNLLDRTSNRFTRFRANPGDTTSLASGSIYSLFEDHLGILWIGTSGGGLQRYDRARKRFVRVGPASAIISRIFEDREETLWIGTWITGLFRYNRTTGQFTQYLHDQNNPTSISHNTVYAIQETFDEGKPTLWVGTRSGFNKFDPATGQFKSYYEKDGLPGDLVYGVLVDNAGDLWLSTQNGLARFNPGTRTFKTFDASDGLQSNEFSFGAFYKSSSGELFFGGINGLNAFRPESIKENSYIPPVAVTAFKVFDRQIPGVHSLSEGDSVRLTYRENFFSFEFAALHFVNPQKNRYAYKLEGFDNDWIYSGSRRYASYTNVDPGEYVFRVKAANPSGVWNEKGVSVKLFISPPRWKTWWAYILYALLILSAIYTVRRYEMNRIRLKNRLKLETIEGEKLKELDRLKSRFFANISHEFRTPLTLILGQVDSVMSSGIETKEKGKLQVALRNARRLLGLINQLLDLSKIEAGSMELRADRHNLVSFLKNVVYSFESLAEQKKIMLKFESEEENVAVLFEQDKMEKVFYNLLSNAFKFTPDGGSVHVHVTKPKSQTSSLIDIIVSDTGIGIPGDQLPHIFNRFYQVDSSQTREHEGTGIGLALTKELVELHDGTITVTSREGKGTEFVIRLPREASGDLINNPEVVSPPAGVIEGQGVLEEEQVEQPVRGVNKVSDEIILIVEDNADVRAYIREQLENSYRVIEATNGEEGIAQAQKAIPDLIITDVMMPKMDGYQFTRKIRADEKTSHIPIVMLTAKAALDDKIAGLEKGVDVYLTKPFSAKELNVQVRNLITRREELRRRFSTATIIKPSEVVATSIDKAFLEKAIRCIESHFEDESFDVAQLANEVNMSISQLNRKFHALVNQAAGELIRSMRLQRAADLLKQNAGTVAEISYKLGFTDQAYFSRAFKKQFGSTPSEYRNR